MVRRTEYEGITYYGVNHWKCEICNKVYYKRYSQAIMHVLTLKHNCLLHHSKGYHLSAYSASVIGNVVYPD